MRNPILYFLLFLFLGCSDGNSNKSFNPADAPYRKTTDEEFRSKTVILEKPAVSEKLVLSVPVNGEILRPFGSADGESKTRGIDFALTETGPVMAAHPGRVIFVSSAVKGWGKVIIIEAEEGFQTVYAHHGENRDVNGQHVQAGAEIAWLAAGGKDKSVLYFEFRRGEIPEDPAPYFQKA